MDDEANNEQSSQLSAGCSRQPISKSANESKTDSFIMKTKKKVEYLFAQNSDRLQFKPKMIKETNRKVSDVWTKFKQAFVDDQPVDIWKCDLCPSMFVYKSLTGSTAMSRHDCSQSRVKINKKSHQEIVQTIKTYVRKMVPDESVRQLNRDITMGLAKDLQPLKRVEAKGFVYICQSLINFGAKYGSQPFQDIIHDRQTLQRTHLPYICNILHAKVKLLLEGAPSYPKFAFSSDMWSEKYCQDDFLSLTAHFVTNEWKLSSVVLGIDQFDDKKTTVNIRKEVKRIMQKFFLESDIDLIIENSIGVTDSGSNMLKVFPRRLPCHCHKINLFVEWTLNDKPTPTADQIAAKASRGKTYKPKKLFKLSEQCPQIKASLQGIKELVTYFKSSHLNSKLDKTLKQDVPIRWNSQYIMFESYINSADNVKALLLKAEQLEKVVGINDHLVKEVLAFLKPFKECSEVLSGDKYSTINLVALWYHKLSSHIKINCNDSYEVQTLKEQAAYCFEEYCKVEDFHYVACMLDPRYKSLKFADIQKKIIATQMLQGMLEDELKIEKERDFSLEVELHPVVPQNPTKICSRFEEYLDDIVDNEECELDRYQRHRLPRIQDDDKFDLLGFWRDANEFPILQKVARWVLAIPASEAPDERNFSSAGRVKTENRTVLKAETLSQHLFIHKNADI